MIVTGDLSTYPERREWAPQHSNPVKGVRRLKGPYLITLVLLVGAEGLEPPTC